jgi:DNA gyrase/topoisomerase IV subunit A
VQEEMTPEELREHQGMVAANRLPIVDGLLRAIDMGWPLIEAIEVCADRSEAQRRLTEPPFSFDEVQAMHVLDLQLGQRTAERRRQLTDEKAELARVIAEG